MVDAKSRQWVRQRALNRCEYCQIHQDDFDFYTFHIEHIIPRQHGGEDDADNLALACPECNSAKGTNLVGILEGKIVPLFHPRRQVWKNHFRWNFATLDGKTRSGKVTVQVLNINDPARILVRENLRKEGLLPGSNG